MLPDYGTVLRFRQTIVVGVPGPRFCLLHQQLVQHLGHPVINVLAAVVGMEAEASEGELRQNAWRC
jgi:hypothetical protein